MPEKPFTPETLADRWGVTGKCIRDLCVKGTLSFFKVGKLYRIPAEVVDTYERGNGWNTGSNSTGEHGASSGEKAEQRSAKASRPQTSQQPSGRLRIINGPGNQPIVTR